MALTLEKQMSKKTSFRLVVTLAGKTLQENRFAVGKDCSATAVKRTMDSAMGGSFNADAVDALRWAGCKVVVVKGTTSHDVVSALTALKWVMENL